MSNGHGGAREGSGRPKGSDTSKSRDSALRLAMDGGETPFGVMLKTMRALWKEATKDGDGEIVVDMDKARDAVAVAEKAAPYVHPKLNAIALENGNDEPFIIKFDKEDANA